jgi:hypothetical protein
MGRTLDELARVVAAPSELPPWLDGEGHFALDFDCTAEARGLPASEPSNLVAGVGYEAEYEGRPPVYSIGCAGLITHAERLPDGRSNIVLQGLEKFRILDERHERSYRRAVVEPIGELMPAGVARVLREARQRLESLVAPIVEGTGSELKIPPTIPDAELVNALAQYLPLESVEKQALLERDGVLQRCRSLIELLEMKVLIARQQWGAGH